MKIKSICLILFVLVFIPPAIFASDGKDVDPAVIDAIAANFLNTKFKSAAQSVRNRITTQLLREDGSVIHEDVRWERHEYDTDGNQTVFNTDRNGNDLQDHEPGRIDGTDSKRDRDKGGDCFALPKTMVIQTTSKALFVTMRFNVKTDVIEIVPKIQ